MRVPESKEEGGGTCVVMAQWDHYCNAASIPSLRTDLFLLFLSFSLSFFLLLPFPPIRIFVAFISLVHSFLRNFRYALKARRAFARLGFAQLVTMRRLQGICRIKNFRGTRRWTKARWLRPTKILGIQRSLCRHGVYPVLQTQHNFSVTFK